MPTIEIVGVYPLEAEEPVHLIEMLIHGCDGVLDLTQITQAQQSKPKSNWQVPWMEYILDKKGKTLLSKAFDADRQPVLWHGDVRLVFYFHYLIPNEKLMTPFGNLSLPQPSGMPARLSTILSYEQPGKYSKIAAVTQKTKSRGNMVRKNFVAAMVVATTFMWLPSSQAGKYNKVLNIGDPAPAWSDLPAVNGRKVSLADFKDKDVVVVVFTCNSCPIAEGYEDRILAFYKKYCGHDRKVAMVAINVNLIPEDRLPSMKERAKAKGFAFPYLFDATQKIAKDYGAVYTPEFFVLDKNRKVIYMGAMDDRVTDKDVKINYLEPAVEAALKGEKAKVSETRARGCMIRYLRARE